MSARNFQVYGTKNRFGTVTILREEDSIGVQLHDTVIVRKTLTSIVLNSDGWTTVTTKQAMNHALRQMFPHNAPYVRQAKFVWYVKFPNGDSIPFEDNMEIPLTLLAQLVMKVG